MKYSFIVMDPPTRDTFATLRDCGYDGIELNMREPFDLDSVERNLEDHNLVMPSFLTGEAYFDGLCLSSPRAEVRRQTVERLIRYVDIAHRFKSIMVVGLLQGLRRDEPDPAIAATRIRDGLRAVADVAESKSVEFVIEPVNHLQVGFHNSVAEVRNLIAEVGFPAIRPMVDTIHMNIEESSLTQPILDCGSSLRHIHLCESNGGRFGSGHIPFAEVLATLRTIHYHHFASVKVYRHLAFAEAAKSSIDFLKAFEN